MKVSKEGIYRDNTGQELPVLNCNKVGEPYFRAYYDGGYYNVNEEPDNAPFGEIEWEMVEFVRNLDRISSFAIDK